MNNMKQTQDDRTIQPFSRSTIQRVKAYAFTLAETLIVIGIIGVVAALTLPNLNHATGDKEKVTKVKKIYAALTDAFDRAQAIYGPFDEWCDDFHHNVDVCNERFKNRISEFLKVSKDCSTDEGCWSQSKYYSFYGSQICDNYYDCISNDFGNVYFVTLQDGTSLAFRYAYDIKVDIDGPNKGKTQDGRDIFSFGISTLKLNEDDRYDCYLYLQLSPACIGLAHSYDGYDFSGNSIIEMWNRDAQYYATAWIIQNNNMDYLKCLGELNWETKTSCE